MGWANLRKLAPLRGETAKFTHPMGQVSAGVLFIIWPFTRLVHAFSAPFGYLFRPYVVYRDRGPHNSGSHAPKRGGERVD
jgi:nitrate reductase gamma subunit